MSIYEVVLTLSVGGQECSNVFHYAPDFIFDFTENISEPLYGEFLTIVMNSLDNALSSQVLHVRSNVRDVYKPSDFYEDISSPPSAFGTRSGQAMPPFVALAFRGTRLRVGWNRWYKRFAGVSESDVAGSVWDGSGGAQAILEAQLAEPLVLSTSVGSVTFYPQLVRKEKYLTPSGNAAYRYFASEATQRLNMIIVPDNSVQFHRLTTQRSRLAGVGV